MEKIKSTSQEKPTQIVPKTTKQIPERLIQQPFENILKVLNGFGGI